MQEATKTTDGKFLFVLVPTFPSILFGVYLTWLQGVSSSILSIVFFVMLLGGISGFFLWLWHVDQIDQQNSLFHKKNRAALNQLMAYTTELERLLISVTPKVFDQVLAARELTEQEISILIRRFSAMLDELQQIIDFADQASSKLASNSVENLRKNAEKIRGEIDVVLEALQFQDRVSQILSQVESNLTNLKKTVEKIQLAGSDRNQSLIKVEAMLANIESNYESVNHLPNRSMTENAIDELTFF
jgi:methyl-accepting chemotaxis protein